MSALLCTLVVVAAINTIDALWDRFSTPITANARAGAAGYTLAIGCWALWLLAKGVEVNHG